MKKSNKKKLKKLYRLLKTFDDISIEKVFMSIYQLACYESDKEKKKQNE